MYPISNLQELPGLKLQVRSVIALDPRMNVGEALHCAKRDQAHKLAQEILNNNNFFSSRSRTVEGHSAIELIAETLVLTIDEYRELKEKAFADGMRHARGYMNVNDRF
jgi:hypothetical protein